MDWADKFLEHIYYPSFQVFYNPKMKVVMPKSYWDMYKYEGWSVVYDYINYRVTIGDKHGS